MKIKNAFKGGRVNIPSSKSYHHRYLIANALSLLQNLSIKKTKKYREGKHEIEIRSIGICDDVLATINAIKTLGIEVEILEEQNSNLSEEAYNSINIIRLATKLPFVKQNSTDVKSISTSEESNNLTESEDTSSVFPFYKLPNEKDDNHSLNFIRFESSLSNPSKTYQINVEESGSTLRFLIPICIALNIDVWIYGKGTLIKRPLDDYIKLFQEKKIDYCYHGVLPIHLAPNQAAKLTGTLYVSTQISSQFLSGLLFACPLLDNNSSISVNSKLKSEDYINMTLDVLNQCGITIQKSHSNNEKNIFDIEQNQCYQSKDVFIEGDYSCAAFLIAAGILCKEVQIANLNPNSLQGDRTLIDVLKRAGADIQFIDHLLHISPSRLHAMEIDAQGIIDSVPILCVLFATAEGITKIYNVERLKAKESDRIKSSLDMISSLGGKAYYHEEDDCIMIQGVKQLKGGFVHTFSDHRIAMSATIAALICEDDVEIDDYKCVSKSYTDFFHDFKKLGGEYVI